MHLKIQHFVIFITMIGVFSCKQNDTSLTRIEGKQVPIDSTHAQDKTVEDFVSPFRNRINEILDSTLAYAPKTITYNDGEYNTTAGNLLADLIYSEGNPIFKSRTGKEIDFVLLNHGGIRAEISAGNVSARNAFQVMPFENNLVVVEIKGIDIHEMISFLVKSGRAHPISGMQLVMDSNKNLLSAKIQDNPIDENRNYYVATSDYLVSGGDNMGFFKNFVSITDTDYLIRNAMIDYFKKVDTLNPKVDDRFYIKK